MRIGILGAQGVGKTTLAEALSKELEYPLIREVVRDVMKDMGITSPRELKDDVEKSTEFQRACLYRQIEEEGKHKNFVSDRTTIDNAAYWMKWHAHKNPSHVNTEYYQTAWENAKKYDLLVYVPPEIPLVGDGCRSTNKDYQEEMAWLIGVLLYTWGERRIAVTGLLETRVKKVLAEMRRRKKEHALSMAVDIFQGRGDYD